MGTNVKLWLLAAITALFFIQLISCKKESTETLSAERAVDKEEVEAAVLNDKLVAWYTFNGDILDHSGNSNNIDYNTATTATGKNGKPNTAYLFNGTSSYMSVPNSPSLNPPAGITLAALFKPTDYYFDLGFASRILMKGVDDQSNGDYFLGFYNTGIAYGTYGDNQYESNGVSSGENAIKLNKWYKMVYTYNGNIGKLYINGVLVNRSEKKAVFTPNDDILRIGTTGRPDYPYWFNGVIDEIRIYNSALTPVQVLKVTNALGK